MMVASPKCIAPYFIPLVHAGVICFVALCVGGGYLYIIKKRNAIKPVSTTDGKEERAEAGVVPNTDGGGWFGAKLSFLKVFKSQNSVATSSASSEHNLASEEEPTAVIVFADTPHTPSEPPMAAPATLSPSSGNESGSKETSDSEK